MVLSRQIWANLIEVDSSLVLTLNEDILGEEFLLASYLKREEEALVDFLKRVKDEVAKKLKITIASIFFGFWERGYELQQLADNLQEKQLRGSDFEQILAALNLRLAGSFNLFSCLLKRGTKSLKKEVVVLNSSRKSLQRVDPKGGQKSVSLNWDKLLKRLGPTSLTKREFDLYLRYGFNLADINQHLLIPDLDLGCYLKVRDLLAGKIKDLGLRPGSCVIISGFLTTFKGIKSFLNSEFNLDVFISLKQGLTSERLLNKALNSSIKGEGLLRANINDTSEYVISLKRTTRMLEWFYSILRR